MAMRFIVFWVASLFLGLASWGQAPVLPSSQAQFRVDNFSFNTVTGTFTGFSGTVAFNPQALADGRLDVCLSVETLQSGIDKRDAHLQAKEWFNAAEYPKICFVAEEFTDLGNQQYLAKGRLQLKGRTKAVSIPLTYTPGQLSGELTLNRLEYNLGSNTCTFTVGNAVHVKITGNLKT